MRGEGKRGTMALKLNMRKAYDQVEWAFLELVMFKMGFGGDWVGRVMNCLSSVSFAFKVKGNICGSVIPSRGLRQGDPISLYIFVLCAEAFSSLLNRAAERKEVHGARICRGALRVSYFLPIIAFYLLDLLFRNAPKLLT